jgi:hypothetical protein
VEKFHFSWPFGFHGGECGTSSKKDGEKAFY